MQRFIPAQVKTFPDERPDASPKTVQRPVFATRFLTWAVQI